MTGVQESRVRHHKSFAFRHSGINLRLLALASLLLPRVNGCQYGPTPLHSVSTMLRPFHERVQSLLCKLLRNMIANLSRRREVCRANAPHRKRGNKQKGEDAVYFIQQDVDCWCYCSKYGHLYGLEGIEFVVCKPPLSLA